MTETNQLTGAEAPSGNSRIPFTDPEKRILRNAERFKMALFSACVICAGISYIWFKHFQQFAANPFFLTYNIICYSALIYGVLYSAYLWWRLHQLFRRISKLSIRNPIDVADGIDT